MFNANIEEIQQDTIYALAQSADMLYAARTSGLYRSCDNGNTWEDVGTDSFTAASVAAFGNTIIAGANGAILHSQDAGQNWHVVALTAPPPFVLALAISLNDAEIIAAATAEDGVFISSDRGVTWTAWNFGLLDLNVCSLVISPNFEKDRTIFAGTESGIFRSHNGGRSWRETSFPMDAAPVLSLAASPDAVRIYAGTEENGLFASGDFGKTWQQAETDLISGSVNLIQIAASEITLLLDDKLISSSDGGCSWKIRHTFDQTAMTMLSISDGILIGSADGRILQLR